MLYYEDEEIKQKVLSGELCIQHFNRQHLLYNRQENRILELNCKSWRCPKHQKQWLHRWQVIVSRETKTNPVDKLITLTFASKVSPSQISLARQLLLREMRAKYGDYSYLSVLEFSTVQRMAHLHLLARGKYIYQKTLSKLWYSATKSAGVRPASVVYIEAPRSQEKATYYAIKYALNGAEKGQAIPLDWQGRKITYSHNFFKTGTPRQIWEDYLVEKFGPRAKLIWELKTNQEMKELAARLNQSTEVFYDYLPNGQKFFQQYD